MNVHSLRRLAWPSVVLTGIGAVVCGLISAAGPGTPAGDGGGTPALSPTGPPPVAAPAPPPGAPPVPPAGQILGTITIPHLRALGHPYHFTIRQGVDKATVLDSGAVGHYDDTQLPGTPGNFGLAAHRNTHGEPFRWINRLAVGDTVLVDTPHDDYRYVLDRELPQTTEQDYAVLDPIPAQGGYRSVGQYLTLTTCTPEFTSEYRLIWWGHLVSRTPTAPLR
ncbi:class E sortase [Streptacidiphilus cavernicola]|uniref:Class E sortase n=1 Tax=Streptacidiphilus cavernicola TaxID=3342716 RepID=A0ABV6VZE4_9ACTN